MKNKLIKICIVNFWERAFKKGDFYEYLLNQALGDKYEIIEDGNNADVVISSVFGDAKFPREKTIFIIGESIRPNFLRCKYALSHDQDSYYGYNCYLPIWYNKIAWPGFEFISQKKFKNHPHEQDGYGYISLDSLISKRRLNPGNNKKKFCAIIAANPEALRINLYAFINKVYKKVDGYGPMFGKIAATPKATILQEYKFCLCPENSFYPGYITEKLIEAWYSGTIPIWSGSLSSKRIFNQNAFLNYQKFNEMDKFIQNIIRIDQNDEEYTDIFEQPLLLKKPDIKIVINFLRRAILNIADS